MMLSSLEAFVHTAEGSSFRGAAVRLGVTPAAVSKALARLEGELGVALLHRTSRRVSLTPEGAAFLPHARAADETGHADPAFPGRELVPPHRLRGIAAGATAVVG